MSKLYQKNKNDPPVARDLPPIAGKIAWARQLYRRIQEPMEVFKQQGKLLEMPEAKRIIKNFNKLAKVLLEFEMLYHRGWLRQIEAARSGLQASLLIKHPETAELFVNFDPQILTMVRETECMARLGLEIPPLAITMRAKQTEYKDNYSALQMLLQENKRVRNKIPTAFESLMGPHVSKVDKRLEPGLSKLSWTSLNIQEYIQEVYSVLGELELLMDRAHDLMEFRIDAVLKEMSTTKLCQLPEDEPWLCDAFLENTQMLCAKGAVALQTKSLVVEEAANELINMLCPVDFEDEDEKIEMEEDEEEQRSQAGSPTGSQGARTSSRKSRPVSSKAHLVAKKKREMRENIEEAANELLAHFNHRNQDALMKVTKNTLESLRKRITSSSMVHYLGDSGGFGDAKKDSGPFFKTSLLWPSQTCNAACIR